MIRYFKWSVSLTALMLLFGCAGGKDTSATSKSTIFDRTVQPTPGKVPSLTLPEIQNFKLSNGLSLKLVEHHELPIVNLRLVVKTGSFQDPEGKSGTADFTADMLDEGTTTKNAFEIADAKDFIGARLNTGSGWDGSFVTVSSLKKHLEAAVEIFADVSLNPTFPADDMEKIRERRLASILQRKDQPRSLATLAFGEIVFGDLHPYGTPTTGTEMSIKSLTQDNLKTYYSTYYTANNASLIVVGDVTESEILPLLETRFGKWKSGKIPESESYPVKEISESEFYLVDKPEAAQSYIYFGHNSIARDDPDYIPARVLNQVLGAQFSSRLMQNLREDKGYTYGARSSFSTRRNGGPFTARASVKTSVTDSSVIEFLYELRRIRETPVSEEELERAKNGLVLSLPSSFETPSQIALILGNLVLNGLPDEYYNSFSEKVGAVTRDDVLSSAKKLIDTDHMAFVISGDVSQIKESLEMLNEGKVNIFEEK